MKQNKLKEDRIKYDNLLADVLEEIGDIHWVEKHHLPFHSGALLYAEHYFFKANQLARKHNWNGLLGKIRSTLAKIRREAESSYSGKLALKYAQKGLIFIE